MLKTGRRTLFTRFLPATALLPWATRPAQAQAPKPIVIALSSNSLAWGGLRIAEQLKLFEKNGLMPRIIVLDSGSAATAALIGGSADFAGSGPAEVIAARVRGLGIGIVTSLYRGFAAPIVLATSVADKLPVNAQAPLIERFKALNGLTIAVPSATSALLAPVRQSIEDAGAKARFVYLAQPTMPAALQAGAIQGFVASSPFWTLTVLNKTGVIWIDAPRGELPAKNSPASSAVLETTTAYASANPDIIRRVRAVFVDAAAAITQDLPGALQALTRAYPLVDAETLKIAFDHDAGNWTKPALSDADLMQEIALLRQATDIPGLDTLKPSDLFIK